MGNEQDEHVCHVGIVYWFKCTGAFRKIWSSSRLLLLPLVPTPASTIISSDNVQYFEHRTRGWNNHILSVRPRRLLLRESNICTRAKRDIKCSIDRRSAARSIQARPVCPLLIVISEVLARLDWVLLVLLRPDKQGLPKIVEARITGYMQPQSTSSRNSVN